MSRSYNERLLEDSDLDVEIRDVEKIETRFNNTDNRFSFSEENQIEKQIEASPISREDGHDVKNDNTIDKTPSSLKNYKAQILEQSNQFTEDIFTKDQYYQDHSQNSKIDTIHKESPEIKLPKEIISLFDKQIIWYDSKIDLEDFTLYIKAIQSICDTKTFSDLKEATDYLTSVERSMNFLIITSLANGERLVAEIASFQNISYIIVFDRDKNKTESQQEWPKKYENVMYFEKNNIDLLPIILQIVRKAHFPVFSIIEKNNMSSSSIKNLQSFSKDDSKYSLIDLKNTIWNLYQNSSNLNLEKFYRHYSEYLANHNQNVLKWYTQDSVLQNIISFYLRNQAYDSSNYFEEIIKGLQVEIQQNYFDKIQAYSGLLHSEVSINSEEWSELYQSVGKFIELRGFLFANKVKNEKDETSLLNLTDPKLSILILVPVIPDKLNKSFAEIAYYKKQVLFNYNSKFKILETSVETKDRLEYRRLILLFGVEELQEYVNLNNSSIRVEINVEKTIECKLCHLEINLSIESLVYIDISHPSRKICLRCLEEYHANNDSVLIGMSSYALQRFSSSDHNLSFTIKGIVVEYQFSKDFPFYGYECIVCKKVKSGNYYHKCLKCFKLNYLFCSQCFNQEIQCVKEGHSFIIEKKPFTFWSDINCQELYDFYFEEQFLSEDTKSQMKEQVVNEISDFNLEADSNGRLVKECDARSKDQKEIFSVDNSKSAENRMDKNLLKKEKLNLSEKDQAFQRNSDLIERKNPDETFTEEFDTRFTDMEELFSKGDISDFGFKIKFETGKEIIPSRFYFTLTESKTSSDMNLEMSIPNNISQIMCNLCQDSIKILNQALLFIDLNDLHTAICWNCLKIEKCKNKNFLLFLSKPIQLSFDTYIYQLKLKGDLIGQILDNKIDNVKCFSCSSKISGGFFMCLFCEDSKKVFCDICSYDKDNNSCLKSTHQLIVTIKPRCLSTNQIFDFILSLKKVYWSEKKNDFRKIEGAQNCPIKIDSLENRNSQIISIQIKDIKAHYCFRNFQIPQVILIFINICRPSELACEFCLQEYASKTTPPLFCVSFRDFIDCIQENINFKIEGFVMEYQDALNIPFYGYKCENCHQNNHSKKFFRCLICKKKYCEDCLHEVKNCTNNHHPVILENQPFSFWDEGMSERDLKSLDFQEQLRRDLITNKFCQGEVLVRTLEYEKAIKYYSEYLSKDRLETLTHQELKVLFESLGSIYHQISKPTEAIEYYLLACKISQLIYGESHITIADLYYKLGLIYKSINDYNKSLEYYLKSRDIKKNAYGDNHADLRALDLEIKSFPRLRSQRMESPSISFETKLPDLEAEKITPDEFSSNNTGSKNQEIMILGPTDNIAKIFLQEVILQLPGIGLLEKLKKDSICKIQVSNSQDETRLFLKATSNQVRVIFSYEISEDFVEEVVNLQNVSSVYIYGNHDKKKQVNSCSKVKFFGDDFESLVRKVSMKREDFPNFAPIFNDIFIWQLPGIGLLEKLKKDSICKIQVSNSQDETRLFLKATSNQVRVIFSYGVSEDFVEEVVNLQNVSSVYIYSNQDKKKQVNSCSKVKFFGDDFESLVQKANMKREDFPNFAPIFNDVDKSENNHLHLYLQGFIIFKDRKQAKEDFLALAKNVYPFEIEKIKKFDREYNDFNKKDIINWYTQDNFFHKILNNCLRMGTPDSILYCRLIIKDLEIAIKEVYQQKSNNFSGLLYRGSYLSAQEWKKLQENIGKEIETYGFLSTSLSFQQAKKFKKDIFITIIVLPSIEKESQGFAEIKEYSLFPNEEEVLFNLRSRFTILEANENIDLKDEKNKSEKDLILLYGAQAMRFYMKSNNPIINLHIDNIAAQKCHLCERDMGIIEEAILFVNLNSLSQYICKKCQSEFQNKSKLPLLCISLLKHKQVYDKSIEGYCLRYQDDINIPFYGYKCGKCKKTPAKCYKCLDCTDSDLKWCENCFNINLDCLNNGHAIVLENQPFSFWTEKMSDNELIHFEYQKDLLIELTHRKFQQGRIFLETQNYEKAKLYFLKYLKSHENISKTERTEIFDILALVYKHLGDSEKSKEFHLESLKIKQLISEEQTQASASNSKLYQQAVDLHSKHLEDTISTYGDIHPKAASVINNLALAYNNLKDYNKAVKMFADSLRINKSLYGDKHPDTATSFSMLGLTYNHLGMFEKAIEYHSESLKINKLIYGNEHPEVANAYNNLGLVYHNMKDYGKAEEFLRWSYEIRKNIYGENHLDVAESYDNLGSLYSELGNFQQTLDFYFKSIEIKKSIYDESHPEIISLFEKVALTYRVLGEDEKATEFFVKAQDSKRLNPGYKDAKIIATFNDLGYHHLELGAYHDAIKKCSEALRDSLSTNGKNHLETAKSYRIIGLAHIHLQQYTEAIENLLKCLEITRSIFKTMHLKIAQVCSDLGLAHDYSKNFEKAIEYYWEALKINQTFSGDKDPYTAESYERLGSLYFELRDNEKAVEFSYRAFELYKAIYGESHSITKAAWEKYLKVSRGITN